MGAKEAKKMCKATQKQIDCLKRMYDFIYTFEGNIDKIDYDSLSKEEASKKIEELKPRYDRLYANPALRKKYKIMHPGQR